MQRICGLHVSPCLHILDKDHQGKRSAEKMRKEEEEIIADKADGVQLDLPKWGQYMWKSEIILDVGYYWVWNVAGCGLFLLCFMLNTE